MLACRGAGTEKPPPDAGHSSVGREERRIEQNAAGRSAASVYWPAVGAGVAGCAWNGSSTVVSHTLGFPDGPVRLTGSRALS